MATSGTIDLSEPDPPPARRWNRCLNGASSTEARPHVGARAPANIHMHAYPAAGSKIPTASAGWQMTVGDDALSSERLKSSQELWRRTVERCSAQRPFEDEDFPAEVRSLFGRAPATKEVPESSGQSKLHCRCGGEAAKSQVKKEGPTKGRPYWHCPTRRCGFFAWADARARQNAQMWWARFPEFVVVSDFGFRAEDLRQGGVGDCWFMSALAVVAERPDLILRLFAGETAKNSGGCYQVQLFLDGEWQGIVIDDRLPCTDKQRRPDGSSIAYSRADGQQLWTALVEKAYAKAHGSYRAISGGEVAEALLDLTGCPTESIDFSEDGFDLQEFWTRLLHFKELEFPMGCGTASDPELDKVGLCGSHAYSILDIREIYDPCFVGKPLGYGGCQEDGTVRLLRIRNPHGVGEWTGEWSDNSSDWTENLARHLGCSGVDDGTFWMDFTHFLMAFQEVDVCFAHRGWHSCSFDNAFCAKTSTTRLCKYAYEIRCSTETRLYAMALQPTKRGAWCRDDRKKSYKPGDVSLLLVRLREDRTLDEVVGGNFFCAEGGARRTIEAALDRPGATYLLLAFSFGAGPVAHGGEVRSHAPFKLRMFCSQPLSVRPVEAECEQHIARLAVSTVHTACFTLKRAPGRPFRRQVRRLEDDVFLFQVTGEGAVLVLITNAKQHPICVSLRAELKVMTARTSEGLLTAKDSKAEQITCFNCGKPGHLATDCPHPKSRGIRPAWRYAAKWRQVSTVCRVAPGAQRLALCLIGNGMQTALGSVQAELATADNDSPAKFQGLSQWCGAPAHADVFAPQPLASELVAAAYKESQSSMAQGSRSRAAEDIVDAIKAASIAALEGEEERQLSRALAESRLAEGNCFQDLGADQNGACVASQDPDLARALAASRGACEKGPFVDIDGCVNPAWEQGPFLDRRDGDLALALSASKASQDQSNDAALQAALRLSMAPSAFARTVDNASVATIVDSDSDVEVPLPKVEPASGVTKMPDSPCPKRPKLQAQTYYHSGAVVPMASGALVALAAPVADVNLVGPEAPAAPETVVAPVDIPLTNVERRQRALEAAEKRQQHGGYVAPELPKMEVS